MSAPEFIPLPEEASIEPALSALSEMLPAISDFLTAGQTLLQGLAENLLVVERGDEGVGIGILARDGRLTELPYGHDAVSRALVPLLHHGAILLDALSLIWPHYAVPARLSVLTDGRDICFSPDRPDMRSPDWLAEAVGGSLQLWSLRGREAGSLMSFLGCDRTVSIH